MVIFALSLVPLVTAVGAAVDYARAASLHSQLMRGADAAAIAALTTTKDKISNGSSDPDAIAAGKTAGEAVYARLMQRNGTVDRPTIDIQHAGRTVSVRLSASSPSMNVFSRFVNKASVQVGVQSAASGMLDPFVDVALLIDVSGSMAIGADQSAIDRLGRDLGCAFACHDGVPVKGTTMDAYQWAVSQGIPLRTQAINNGLVEFLDWMAALPKSGTLNRVALFSFADALTPLTLYTSNIASAKSNLPKTTNAASEYTGATHFKSVMPFFTTAVGAGGDGGSAMTAKKLVIIATDGVEDPNRTWTWDWSLRPQVTAFDPAACQALKNAGVSVGIIHTAYVPLWWDWGYQATLGQPSQIGGPGTRVDDVAPQLRKCASPGLYVVATSNTIGQAFQNIFQNFSANRLTQ